MPKLYDSMKGPGSVGLFTWILVMLLLLYLGYRAKTLSFTHDEAYTYTRYVHHTYLEIVSYQTGNILPNNHILNTFAQKYFSEKFGATEFVLRLANLITGLLFLVVAMLLSSSFTGLQRIATFAVLTLHPYVLDFMMLSRGYGIAISFMLTSVYFFLHSVKRNFNPLFLILGLLSATISVLANFSWLNYFVVVCPLIVVFQVVFSNGQSWKNRLLRLFITIGGILGCVWFLYAWITEPLEIIIQRKLLFGGESGFWSDTVLSLCDRLAYGAVYKNLWMIFIQSLVVVILLGAAVCSAFWIRNRKTSSDIISLVFLLLVQLGMVVVTLVQVHFFGSYYPEERTALIYVPVFLVLTIYLIKYVQEKSSKRIWGIKWVLPVLSLIFASHMLNSINFKYVLDWKYDANTREIAHDIEVLEGPILLGVHPFFQPAFEFYRRIHHLTKFGELHVDGYRKEGEYYYFVIPDTERQKILEENLTIVKEYKPSRAILAKK